DVQKTAKAEFERLEEAYQGEELKANKEKLFEMALESMINRELVYMDFVNLKAQVPATYIQERIDTAISTMAGGDELLFEDNLYKQGMTMKEYRENVQRDIAIELLLRNRVKNGISIPDTAVEKYYNEHKYEMVKPPKYHFAVLLIRGAGKFAEHLEDAIAELKKKLSASGVDFAALVREYSEGANAENGGDQGWIDSPHELIKNAIKDLKAGEILAQPVKIGDNYYFVKLIEVNGGGVPQLNAELHKTLKDRLAREEENKRYKDYIRELHMKYPVKLFR
ncbi:MAG: peptidyl-prolyl cis-trans isomerase, partial [Victivallales bacterium]|nr:peptidyl-prolyl cis-trans isomerase [Victivallales bacterium]